MPLIYDNIEKNLTDGLNDVLIDSERVDMCIGYFNLRGWKEIAQKIDTLPGGKVIERDEEVHRVCRLLVGMQKMPLTILEEYFDNPLGDLIDNAEVNRQKRKLAEEFKNQLTIGTPTDADETALRRLCRQLKEKKVVVKLHLRFTLHAKLYIAYRDDKWTVCKSFLGSSNLTFAGLSKQGELNIDVDDPTANEKLVDWFNKRWNDRWCIDITNELIEIIDESWAADRVLPPYWVYLKMAYHLSREARAGMNEFKLPRVFQKELLEFQQKAVQVAAHHLNRRGGVLIGDVVGLGKTITATALAKMFEDDFSLETLILCPKNLKEMWEDYCHKYQLRAKVISQTRVQTELPKMRRYRLVIIDESHNLRNDEGSRYRAIKNYLDENESKVVLLTATPYNKSFVDLSNQLRLFLADDSDIGISPERYIDELGGPVHFGAKHTETFIRSIKAFERSANADDWRELMRLYLVRRTRSFIKSNYAEIDESNGRSYLTFSDGTRFYFPERQPKKVEYLFDPNDPTDQYAKLYTNEVVVAINSLDLPRYGLWHFLDKAPSLAPTSDEKAIMANLSRAGRRLMGFCRTNLFKRLESSGCSFLLSLGRHVLRNMIFVYALQNGLPVPLGKNVSENLDGFLDDEDLDSDVSDDLTLPDRFSFSTDEEAYLTRAEAAYLHLNSDKLKKKFDWVRSEFFVTRLKELLIEDSRRILKILTIGKDWVPAQDRQLNALIELISRTHSNEKILVFSQFADTVSYLFSCLKDRGIDNLEMVTGDSENPTDSAHRFSPDSNDQKGIKGTSREIRVLLSTDVLSEGQNLQDARIVVNYDLPWAIIRLIQRAGRVDRIGQKAPEILCYSFLPEDGIEQIINLRKRLKKRISENAEVVGSDETFFDGDPINIADLYSEKSGILDEEGDDAEVDLASFAYQIWKNATDAEPKLNKIVPELPDVVYSTKVNPSEASNEGVVVYTRTSEDNDVLTWIAGDGDVVTQSQYAILRATACDAETEALPRLTRHHELVKKAIDYIREDEKNAGTSLGKKSGVKYRTYTRLDRYCKDHEGTLFVTDQLKKGVDDILNRQMTEFARETFSRQLKAGISDEQLAELVVSLREADRLVKSTDEEKVVKAPQIICSLGMKNV